MSKKQNSHKLKAFFSAQKKKRMVERWNDDWCNPSGTDCSVCKNIAPQICSCACHA